MLTRCFGYSRILATGAPAPLALIDVFNAGTVVRANIFQDDLGLTPLSNPFSADANGYFYFYAAIGTYDIGFSGGGIITPFTWGDVPISNPLGLVTAYTRVGLPASNSTTAGSLARVTDSVRGLWMNTGVNWYDIQGEVLNAKEFGATGDGVTNDAVAIQAACDAALAASLGSIVYLPPGTYNLGNTTINVTGVSLLGCTTSSTTLTYSGIGSALHFIGAVGYNGNYGIVCSNNAAHGYTISGASSYSVFTQIQAVGANTAGVTGAGTHLNEILGGGFATNVTFIGCYNVGFKYGWLAACAGGADTFTDVQWVNCTAVGFRPVIAGSAGLYCDAGSNMEGSRFSGIIEQFDYAVYFAQGSLGVDVRMGAEVINYLYNSPMSSSFCGRIEDWHSERVFSQTRSIVGSQTLLRTQVLGGVGPISETYYAPQHVVFNGSGDAREVQWYRGLSLINGDAPPPTKRFAFGLGITDASFLNYAWINGYKVSNDIGAPVANNWNRGDVVLNRTPVSGGPSGWTCVMSVDTTTTAPAIIGATVLAVVSTTGMTMGDVIGVTQDDGTVLWTTIAVVGGPTSVTLTVGLSVAAASGNAVHSFLFKAQANLA